MGRLAVFPVGVKARIVLAIVAGELSIAQAARQEKVSEQSIGRWKAEFLEGGRAALVAGRSGPSTREQQLEAEVTELTQALGEAHVALRVWRKSAEGRLPPSKTLEVIRSAAGMPTSRFCSLVGIPERSYRRHQARRRRCPARGPWPRPARRAYGDAVTAIAARYPAWGHRKVWALARHEGYPVTASTVLRILDDQGLVLKADYQRERRDLARVRKAAFLVAPTAPNRVWQLDFSEYETTSGGTWRVGGVADYYSRSSSVGAGRRPQTSTTRWRPSKSRSRKRNASSARRWSRS